MEDVQEVGTVHVSRHKVLYRQCIRPVVSSDASSSSGSMQRTKQHGDMNIKVIHSTATLLHCADCNVIRTAENVSGPYGQNNFRVW